ncbi:ribonuclease HI [Desulfonatronovibrio magnus]|uniref:ribonuclease HI n=1 Tax=Desulfonatronovibrio magnus TaxID=698827 RepID=UPI0005EB028E|nr:ribonuclease HI [Desulfonatronovibrio magnus]
MKKTHKSELTIYTDGSCLGNPGPGGYGAVLIYKEKVKEISGGFSDTTNNRMELTGVIAALEVLKYPCQATVFTDSQYIQKAFSQGWISKWQLNGWKTAGKKDVKNKDLWEKLLGLMDTHQVRFKWVKGHSGDKYNERCDVLAREAAMRATDF